MKATTPEPLRRIAFCLACMLLACAALPVSAEEESPWRMDKREFGKQIKKLAVAPLEFPPVLELSDAQVAALETELTERLEKEGFELIPIAVFQALRAELTEQVGGYTGADGSIDAAKMTAVWDHSKREMLFRHDMDAIAYPTIQIVSASFEQDRAEWDGVKQKVESSGDGLGKLFGGGRYAGTIAAASFQLAIFDRNSEPLFVNRGGIEVLMERRGDQLQRLDAADVLKDDKKLKKALRETLKPF